MAPDAHYRALGALVHAYAQKGITVRHLLYDGGVPDPELLERSARDCDAILVSTDGKRSPRSAINGPVIRCGDGRIVPVGILTARTEAQRLRFAQNAARIHSEYHADPMLAILSQRHPRYVRVATRVEDVLAKASSLRAFRWSSDVVFREDMVRGLSSGLGMALYLGHGRPNGWVGYYGLRAHHFSQEHGQPLGALLSLCCQTASRQRTGYAFAERIVLQGSAGACLAAVSPTKFVDNTRWAVRLAQAMEAGATDLYTLMTTALPPSDETVLPYRIIGDPMAPLRSAQGAYSIANSIHTYA